MSPPIRLLSFVLRAGALLLMLGSIPGCDDPPNTQRLPIGQRCSDDAACGTSPYACEVTGYPGGYCDRSCATDGDCPLDSVCVGGVLPHCRRKCTDPTECRQVEGYTCRPAGTSGATSPYCNLPAAGS